METRGIRTRGIASELRSQIDAAAKKRVERVSDGSAQEERKGRSLVTISMAARQADRDKGSILYRIV